MTPDDYAIQLVNKAMLPLPIDGFAYRELVNTIANAVSAERKRCAKVAEEYKNRDPGEDGSAYWASNEIAAAIRALK